MGSDSIAHKWVMLVEITQTAGSRTRTAFTAAGISLFLALVLAWPVYIEVATRSAFTNGDLRLQSATVVQTKIDSGYDMSQRWYAMEMVLQFGDGTKLTQPANDLSPWPDEGDTVQAGLLGNELVSVNGQYVRNAFSFFYFTLLMVLAGTAVFTVIAFIRRHTTIPLYLLPGTTYHAWPAAWLFLPLALLFSEAFDSPWWPVTAWTTSVGLFLALYTLNYRKQHRTRKHTAQTG
ncbi:MAG: hypothetical protein ABW224_08460 [Kibdelosporangium sp.]